MPTDCRKTREIRVQIGSSSPLLARSSPERLFPVRQVKKTSRGNQIFIGCEGQGQQTSEFFSKEIKALESRWMRCIDHLGEHVESMCNFIDHKRVFLCQAANSSNTLVMSRFHPRATAENLQKSVMEVLEDLGLRLRDIRALTTDGAPEMIKLGRLLGKTAYPHLFHHQLCFAHALHLAVTDTLKV